MFLLPFITIVLLAIILIIMLFNLVQGVSQIRRSKLAGTAKQKSAGRIRLINAAAFAVFFFVLLGFLLYTLLGVWD